MPKTSFFFFLTLNHLFVCHVSAHPEVIFDKNLPVYTWLILTGINSSCHVNSYLGT